MTPARATACATAPAASRPLDPALLPDHIDRLYRAAWASCGSREDAEDLVQDTYARVLAKPRLLRCEDDLAYLLRVLRNTQVSRLRAAARRPVSGGEHAAEATDHRSSTRPELALQTRELFEVIATLPPAQRDELVAVDVVGLSYREAARALRVREATVRHGPRAGRNLDRGGSDDRIPGFAFRAAACRRCRRRHLAPRRAHVRAGVADGVARAAPACCRVECRRAYVELSDPDRTHDTL
ncbi:MAG: RNA polymerase sigma factor [Actinomycetota bacterium]|nr:RNA polymerase sigma factor [Actinomycetota bacterium]